MSHGIVNAIISGLGMLWLNIRYRNKDERERILTEKYSGNYRKAGNPVAIVIVIFIFVMELLVEFLPNKYK